MRRLPFRVHVVQTDNGAEFQSHFHWHLEALDIRHVYIRPRTPHLNGKVERSHRVDDQEFYQLLDKDGITDDIHLFNEKLREWEDYYNYHRPHGALDGQTPYERLIAKTRAGCHRRPRTLQTRIGAPCRTRTCDLLVRSQTLYPTELWARVRSRRIRVYRHNEPFGEQPLVREQRGEPRAQRATVGASCGSSRVASRRGRRATRRRSARALHASAQRRAAASGRIASGAPRATARSAPFRRVR